MTLLELAVVAIYWQSLNLANWKPKIHIRILLLFFISTFYHSIRAIIDGNLIILSTFLIVVALIALRDRRDETAGALLAFSFLDIKFILLPIIIIIIYSIINRRYKIIGYFFGTLTLLFGFSFLLLPQWLSGYLHQLVLSVTNYPYYSIGGILKQFWGATGERLSILLAIFSIVLFVFESLSPRKKNFKRFIWFLLLITSLSQVAGLPAEADNMILLLPGLIFGLSLLSERWHQKGDTVIYIICFLLFLITWAIHFLVKGNEQLYFEPPLFFLVLPIFELLLLYWSRWWVVKIKNTN